MNRRNFLSNSLMVTGAAAIGTSLSGFNILSTSKMKQKKLGVALVGLGEYSRSQLGPALLETQYCELRGIVTGTPSKVATWTKAYELKETSIYNYENFDSIADDDNIDIIYVVLPNSMHAEFVIRAAKAGKHVICEKPMATNYEDCLRMIKACKDARKKLSIGYRLHFEPFNLESMRLGQRGIYGKVQEIESGFAIHASDKTRWRLNKELAGGGPLMDVGIYAVQSTLYTLGKIPKSVKAKDTTINPALYGDVEGSLEAQFFFDSKIEARIKTSYEASYAYSRVKSENGNWELNPAYYYGGLHGKTHLGKMSFRNVNQQAAQMDDFARCILENKETVVPGEMGARDVFILDKIYESVATGKEVSLAGIPNILHLV